MDHSHTIELENLLIFINFRGSSAKGIPLEEILVRHVEEFRDFYLSS